MSDSASNSSDVSMDDDVLYKDYCTDPSDAHVGTRRSRRVFNQIQRDRHEYFAKITTSNSIIGMDQDARDTIWHTGGESAECTSDSFSEMFVRGIKVIVESIGLELFHLDYDDTCEVLFQVLVKDAPVTMTRHNIEDLIKAEASKYKVSRRKSFDNDVVRAAMWWDYLLKNNTEDDGTSREHIVCGDFFSY
jgi:hypothetical protein